MELRRPQEIAKGAIDIEADRMVGIIAEYLEANYQGETIEFEWPEPESKATIQKIIGPIHSRMLKKGWSFMLIAWRTKNQWRDQYPVCWIEPLDRQ